MNTRFTLLLVFVVVVCGNDDHKKFKEITKECSATHNISDEKLNEILPIQDKSTIQPTEDLKCFAKCALDKIGFFVPGTGLDVEHLVKIGVSHGREEAFARAKIDKCKVFYKGSNNCDESWALYICFFSE